MTMCDRRRRGGWNLKIGDDEMECFFLGEMLQLVEIQCDGSEFQVYESSGRK